MTANPANAADDLLMGVAQPGQRKEAHRDNWGRYLLPHPQSGRRGAWTRATTFAGIPEDMFALSQWSQRLTLRGASMRPDIAALAHPLDVKQDKDQLNKLVEQAKEAAGGSAAANMGTALHRFAEDRDSGLAREIPPVHRADIDAYTATLARHGVELVPHMIERVTCLPQFASGRALGVAGTFDRIYRMPDGTYVIGDLKTGDITYGMGKIAIQLALYSHGVNENGVYDYDAERWESPGSGAVPTVRTDYGIVVHLPAGKAECTLHRVDLVRGWEGAQLCQTVKDWRSAKGLSEPLRAPLALVKPHPGDFPRRFSEASSQADLKDAYDDAVRAGVSGAELSALVDVGMRRLSELASRQG